LAAGGPDSSSLFRRANCVSACRFAIRIRIIVVDSLP
jgi:hypothetical protein